MDVCGGCPWQRLPLAVQHERLADRVRGALVAELGPASVPRVTVLGTEPDRAWRSTARLHWAQGAMGHHRPGTQTIVDVADCPVLAPPLPAMWAELRLRLKKVLSGRGTLRLTGAPGSPSGTVSIEPATPQRNVLAALPSLLRAGGPIHGGVLTLVDGRVRWFGRPEDVLGEPAVVHPAGSFVQAHQPGNRALVASVDQALCTARRVLELYAGSGNFTRTLLGDSDRRVVAVEQDPGAAARLAAWGRRLPEGRLVVVADDASRAPRGEFDAVLVDPPRAGLSAAALALVVATRAPLLVYVSCEPGALARDTRALSAAGYRLASLLAFDLFPHTGHVETLATLQLAGNA